MRTNIYKTETQCKTARNVVKLSHHVQTTGKTVRKRSSQFTKFKGKVRKTKVQVRTNSAKTTTQMHKCTNPQMHKCTFKPTNLVALLLQRSLVPGRPKLTATPNVGQHKHSASLEPPCSELRSIERQHGNFKTTVTVQQSWLSRIQVDGFTRDHEVGHAGAVQRLGLCVFLFVHFVCELSKGVTAQMSNGERPKAKCANAK